ncbi:MAG TPA: FHA domain-containing protein [Mycobacteriales bacterium]|jgi:pSer/pThr/pTyr-binding forkhead associated (FHA) protein|nr:FHA domain-containing protein [Mycobacteriales bacterium]
MSELAILLVRLGFLALLWLFVFAVLRVIRLDVYGPRVPKATRQPAPSPARAPAPKPKPKQGKMPRHLVVTAGSLAGQTVELDNAPVTIGRAPESTLVLTDDYASSHHARLVPRDGQWLIEDLGSTNGTYLDKAKVTAPTPVPVGGKVRIGKTVLELRR